MHDLAPILSHQRGPWNLAVTTGGPVSPIFIAWPMWQALLDGHAAITVSRHEWSQPKGSEGGWSCQYISRVHINQEVRVQCGLLGCPAMEPPRVLTRDRQVQFLRSSWQECLALFFWGLAINSKCGHKKWPKVTSGQSPC